MVRNNIFTSGFFFQKKNDNCFVQFKNGSSLRSSRHIGVGTFRRNQNGMKLSMEMVLGARHYLRIWGNDIGLILADLYISWYLDTMLWSYEVMLFLADSLNFPLNCWIHFEFRPWILMPLPTKTKCSWIPRHCRLRLQWPGSCFTNLYSHSCSCFSGKCCSFCCWRKHVRTFPLNGVGGRLIPSATGC